MAGDILSIPILVVASELALRVGAKVPEQYRIALEPKNIETLICTQDWLFGKNVSVNFQVITYLVSYIQVC